MKNKAFSALELIFAALILGILSTIATSYFRDDKLTLAAYQTLSHIRYARNLALNDHKFDPKDLNYKLNPGHKDATNYGKYFRSRWQIRFVKQTSGKPYIIGYSVYSDMDRKGNIDGSGHLATHIEAAVNPLDLKLLHNYATCNRCSADTNLHAKFDIVDISLSGGCSKAGFTTVSPGNLGTLAFDEKGRPYYGIPNNAEKTPHQYLLRSSCLITLTAKNARKAVITVFPYSGYAEISVLE